MTLEITRLHLASVTPPGTSQEWPVHGFVVTYPGGAALVDTGVGGPRDLLNDWRVVNRTAAEALAGLDMSPADITMVINTHLHFDHCGQNAVFKHAAFHVQRAELDRARREDPELAGWFDFMGARFELLDGDTEILPGLSVIATPGHTEGHQSVIVQTGNGGPGGLGGSGEPGRSGEPGSLGEPRSSGEPGSLGEPRSSGEPGSSGGLGGPGRDGELFAAAKPGETDLLIGDAAYTPRMYASREGQKLPPGQAADRVAWEASLGRIRSTDAARVHFCHHTDIIHA